jgi:hypothetical protein
MCSGSLIYLLDLGEVMEQLSSGLSPARFRRKVAGSNSTGIFPELTYPQRASIPVLQILLYLSAATGSNKLVPYEIQL